MTGLVFVAMSLNLSVIAHDATHRYRAVGTLTGFTAIFVVCGLGVMGGQDHRAVGLEWLVVSVSATVVYVYGYIQALRRGGSTVGLRSPRLVGGTGLHLLEVVGAALLLGGYVVGLYVAAISMISLLAFMISGAWLLIMGIAEHRPRGASEGQDASPSNLTEPLNRGCGRGRSPFR